MHAKFWKLTGKRLCFCRSVLNCCDVSVLHLKVPLLDPCIVGFMNFRGKLCIFIRGRGIDSSTEAQTMMSHLLKLHSLVGKYRQDAACHRQRRKYEDRCRRYQCGIYHPSYGSGAFRYRTGSKRVNMKHSATA